VPRPPRTVDPPPAIGERLKQIRDDSEQGQGEFAARFGVPARTYQSWERGESWPSCAFLQEMAKAGINVNWVLIGIGDMRSEQPLRLQSDGKKLRAGAVDKSGKFSPLASISDADQERMEQETLAMWRRLMRPGVIGDISGIDGDLAHRLADIHALNAAVHSEDSVSPLVLLIRLLMETYHAAELKISSADVGRIAADEYRAIYEGGDSIDERRAAGKAVQARHMRAAAWAKNTLLKAGGKN